MRLVNQPVTSDFIEVGRIGTRLKKTSASGKEYSSATDYFVPSGDGADLFTQLYGEKPNELEIFFFSDTLAES